MLQQQADALDREVHRLFQDSMQRAHSPQDLAQKVKLLRKLKAGMEHVGRTVKAEATTVLATILSLVAPGGQTTKRAQDCREVGEKRKAKKLAGQRVVPALCCPDTCAQQGPSAAMEIAQHKGREGVTNVWNRSSSMRGVVSDLFAKNGSQQHAKARIATASPDPFADENSAGKGRSVPGQQQAGGGSSSLTQVAPTGPYGAPATLLGHKQPAASPYGGSAVGQQPALTSICAICTAASQFTAHAPPAQINTPMRLPLRPPAGQSADHFQAQDILHHFLQQQQRRQRGGGRGVGTVLETCL
jgi:hypothetical protein